MLIALITCVSSLRVRVDVIDHDVLPATIITEPMAIESAYKVIVSPATPVPVIVGVLSLFGVVIASMVGAPEATVSITMVCDADTAEWFNAGSVLTAVITYDPSFSGLVGVMDHDVLPTPIVTEPIAVEPAYKVIVSPLTPVPAIVGVLSLFGVTIVDMIGISGASVSIVKMNGFDVVPDTFPAASVARTIISPAA